MSMWMKTVLIWGLCYIGASFCAYMDEEPEHDNSSKLSTQSVSVSASSPSKPKDFEPIIGVKTSALLRRGNIFINDDDFDKAEHYFEQALRQDPENSQAYLGKLMAVMKVHNIDELSRVSSSLSEDKLFKHAVEFANDEEKAALQKCLEANKIYIEALKQEQQQREYQKACYLKKDAEEENDIDAMNRAKKIFERLGNYKDSKSLAEEAGQFIDKEFRSGNSGYISFYDKR